MLRITVPAQEFFDDATSTFISTREQVLQLEHSLVSLSKWESKWHKPFMSRTPKTREETLDYIRCMTITQNVNPLTYMGITDKILAQINAYIDDPATATWFPDGQKGQPNREIVTAELIYYWMFSFDIPIQCDKWHLNKLLTQIRLCNAKNGPQKKMSEKEIAAQNRALNAARRKKMNSRG